MGILETNARERKKRRDLRRLILVSIKVAGVLGVGLVAPNVLGAMAKLGIIRTPRSGELIKRSRDLLIKRGLLRYSDGQLKLTTLGEVELGRLSIFYSKLVKPRRWDGLWRMLIFDIPEKQKVLRDKVRRTLISIGFVRLQDSVWIYPYDCEDLVALLKVDFRVGKNLLYLIVDTVENDVHLRKSFGLRQK